MVDMSVEINKERREKLKQAKRWVVKIGSALLTDDGKGLARDAMESWVAQLASLRKQGIELVLVSSGSVAEGMVRLGMTERPDTLNKLQAAAAVGQMGLVQAYENYFQQHGINTAQILLTHDDLSNRKRYLNARSTINTLIEFGVIPIINENDTVVTDEIRFGDNDTLGALVANVLDADGLIILTDQQAMFDSDPRSNPDAKKIECRSANDSALDAMASAGKGALGRGGMMTKVKAARLASRSGAYTLIVGGRIENVLIRAAEGENIGTLLYSDTSRQLARKQWLAGHLQSKGELVLDGGAVKALARGGVSLLPIGVVDVRGKFRRGALVSCLNEQGHEVAKGLVNYDSVDIEKIKGLSSDKIFEHLGYSFEPELLHCDNLVLV